MNITKAENLLNYIRNGKSAVDFFPYENGDDITIRPLTSSEIDKAKISGYQHLNPKMAGIIVKMNLGMIDKTKTFKDVPVEMYKNIDLFLRELDYHIVYFSMKDFMPPDFTIDDVRKMRFVHDIAKKVLAMTSADTNTIIEFIRTETGQELVKIVYRYNIPLVAQASDLTPVQHTFYKWSHPDEPKKVADSYAELGQVLPQLGRVLESNGR